MAGFNLPDDVTYLPGESSAEIMAAQKAEIVMERYEKASLPDKMLFWAFHFWTRYHAILLEVDNDDVKTVACLENIYGDKFIIDNYH